MVGKGFRFMTITLRHGGGTLAEAPPPSDSLSLIMNTNVNCCRATSIRPGLRIADEICGDARKCRGGTISFPVNLHELLSLTVVVE